MSYKFNGSYTERNQGGQPICLKTLTPCAEVQNLVEKFIFNSDFLVKKKSWKKYLKLRLAKNNKF